MSLLSSVLNGDFHRHPFLVLQSSLAQNAFPIIRHLITNPSEPKGIYPTNLLFCLLYPLSCFVDRKPSGTLQLHDWTDQIPGYSDGDFSEKLLVISKNFLESSSPTQSLNIIIDSVDTLLEDKGSPSETCKLLFQIYNLVRKHPNARLILHSQSPSTLLPLITQATFSSSLCHLIVHPSVLISHIATEFLMPPPPMSPIPKFWNVFLPVSERINDTERLVFGSNGEGSGNESEFVVELIVRDVGRKRGVERVLEGWSSGGPCGLGSLENLKSITNKQKEHVQGNASDPTQNLPFNLNLTSSQQVSRAQVPLPYAHEGVQTTSLNIQGAIFYDPDSADDIDDDDPDEDLDI